MGYTRKQFIEKVYPAAVAVMKRENISAALTIAQACLESRNGNSGLTQQANNLFGVKGTGDAGSVVMATKEQRKDGTEYTINAKFAKYSSWQSSIDARTKLLKGGVSWDPDKYKGVLGKRGREAAWAIQKAGYATDTKYAELLIGIMDDYNLYQYDNVTPEGKEKVSIAEGNFVINGEDGGDSYLINGVTYVPLRALASSLDIPFQWDNKKKLAYMNGRELQTFQLIENTVYVQLRPIAEAYGVEIGWDEKTKTASIAV